MRRVTENQVAAGALEKDFADDIWQAWRESAYPEEEEIDIDPFWF